MRHRSRHLLMILLLAFTAACGDERSISSGATESDAEERDAAGDTRDAADDPGDDAGGGDVALDAQQDTGGDDVPGDAPSDVEPDEGDASADAAGDAPVDTAEDAPEDTAADVPTDVAEDAEDEPDGDEDAEEDAADEDVAEDGAGDADEDGAPDADEDATPDADNDTVEPDAEGCIDGDGDGWGDGCAAGTDCDDNDLDVHPGAAELPYDGVDNDCDPLTRDNDGDGDGYDDLLRGGDDCDDGDPARHPGAQERCDGLDNNCAGGADEGHPDDDGDGVASCVDVCPFVANPEQIDSNGDGVGDACPSDTTDPVVGLVVSPSPASLNATVQLTVTATDDVGVAELVADVDGVDVPLTAGRGSFVAGVAGVRRVHAVAVDAAGNRDEAFAELIVVDAAATANPTVALSAPAAEAVINGTTPVRGTATASGQLARWTLTLTPAEGGQAILFAEGTSEVNNALLADLPPGIVAPGYYALTLSALTRGGRQASTTRRVEVRGEAAPGLFRLTWEDLYVSSVGIPIELTRTYDSRRRGVRGDFGWGWSLDVSSIQIDKAVVEGDPTWTFESCGFLCQRAVPNPPRPIAIDLGQGVREYFLFTPEADPFDRYLTVRYTAVSTPGATLTVLDMGPTLFENGGYLFDLGTVELYDPRRYQLDWPDGSRLIVGPGGLESMVDPFGNALTVSASGITHSAGQSVQIARSQGLVTRITDPEGRSINYSYDGQQRLIAVTDREGYATRFIYSDRFPTLLERVVDPNGNTATRVEYDDRGRVVRQCDRAGQCTEFVHDDDNNTEVIVDRTGRPRMIAYDDLGRIVAETDGLGNTTTQEYTNGRRTAQVDAEGNRTEYTYDQWGNTTSMRTRVGGRLVGDTWSATRFGELTEWTNGSGERLTFTRGTGGLLTRATNNAGASESYSYDARGRITGQTDADGQGAAWTWDATSGRVASHTDGAGRAAGWTWDRLGRMTSHTRGAGTDEAAATTFELTPNGRIAAEVDAEGGRTEHTWSPLGKRLATTDPLGRTTAWTYDLHGLPATETLADGSIRATQRDAEGRVVAATDEAGRVTASRYDGAGRLEALIAPDGGTTTLQRDDAGRLTAVTDPEGRVTTWERDERGLVTRAVGQGQALAYTWDDAGRLSTVTDGAGHTHRIRYDAAGRPDAVIYAEGSPEQLTIAQTFSPGSRHTTATDTLGRATTLMRDGGGALIGVTDAAGNTTRYTRDARGNLIDHTDAAARTTTLTLDRLDRLTRRALPSGRAESFTRDAVGNVTAHADFDGGVTTWTFDARDRVIARTLPDGDAATLTWTPDGRRLTLTDPRGTTSWRYDAAGRVASVTQPDGAAVLTTWDMSGRPLTRTIRVGAASLTTAWLYDAEGRLEATIDPDGAAVDYTWSPTGRLAALTHANGATTTHTTNPTGRLTGITHAAPTAAPLHTFAYDWTGPQLASITEDGTDTTVLGFSPAGLLTGATRTGVHALDRRYAFNGAGDITADLAADGAPWSYDADGRLLSTADDAFTWDEAGRLTHRASDDLTLTWSGARLTRAQRPGLTVELAYDYDGLLVSRTVNGVETRYLWDSSTHPPLLVATYTPAGQLLQSFVHDDTQLLQVRQGGQTLSAHLDRQGSLTALSDPSGALAFRRSLDPWGQPLSTSGAVDPLYAFAHTLWFEELGLAYAQARWYDPATGRFISRDPVPGDAAQPLTLNPYLFGRSDPVHYIDPDGRFGLISMSTAITIVVTLHTAIDLGFGLAALTHAMHAIYGQRGYEPLQWEGSILQSGVSLGFLGGASWLYNPSATNELGSTSALVNFNLIGFTIGLPAGVTLGSATFRTYNYGQQHIHPEWPSPGRPNPYPMEGTVVQAGAFNGTAGAVSFTGVNQVAVFGGIAVTAYQVADQGSFGVTFGVSASLVDLFVGSSIVTPQ